MVDPLRVLYVDDEPDLLEIGKMFLEKSGDFSVTTIDSAPAAVKLLLNEKFDAIISDYQMPGMDGIQFLIEIRTKLGPIPFILFTGKGREEVVIQAINSGADFYLQKGGDPSSQFAELVHMIKQAASRKIAGDSLRKSEEKYRHLMEHSNEAIVVVQDGMPKLVNHQTVEFTGYSEQELLSMSITAFIHPDDRAMVMERYQKRMKGEELPSRYAFRLSSKDGSTRWVDISVSAIDWEGRPATLNFLTDITEHKKAEEELKKSEALLKRTGGIARVGGWELDAETHEVTWSEETYHIHEVPVGQMPPLEEAINFFHPDDRKKLSDAITRALTTGEGYDLELRVITATGKQLWTRTLCQPQVVGGKTIRLIGTFQDITERKQAEIELCESEERYRSLFYNNYSVFLLIDPDTGIIEDANAAACRYYGYSHEHLVGMGIYEIIMKDKEKVIRNLKEAKKKKERCFFSTHFLADGKQRNVEIYSGPILANGKLLFYSIIHDVTDRVTAEEELIASRNFIEHTLTTTPALIYIYDISEGRNVYTNRGIFEALGYTPEEISAMGQDLFFRILHPDDAGPVGQHHARFSALPDSTVAEIVYRMKHADGSWRWLHSRDVVFQRTPDGAVKQILGSAIDITDRKQAEEALHHLTEFQESVITNARVWLSVLDLKGIILMWNTAAAEISGYRSDEVIGNNKIWKMLYPEQAYRKQVTTTINRIIREKKYLENFETVIRTKEGNEKIISWNTKGIPDAAGNISDYIAIGVDVTDRKRAEDALNKTVDELKRFNNITLDRELRMIALKEEINGLLKDSGQQEKYRTGS